jgi:hypothetical protein
MNAYVCIIVFIICTLVHVHMCIHMYLTDMEDPEAGGETAFPKGADGLGFKVSVCY